MATKSISLIPLGDLLLEETYYEFNERIWDNIKSYLFTPSQYCLFDNEKYYERAKYIYGKGNILGDEYYIVIHLWNRNYKVGVCDYISNYSRYKNKLFNDIYLTLYNLQGKKIGRYNIYNNSLIYEDDLLTQKINKYINDVKIITDSGYSYLVLNNNAYEVINKRFVGTYSEEHKYIYFGKNERSQNININDLWYYIDGDNQLYGLNNGIYYGKLNIKKDGVILNKYMKMQFTKKTIKRRQYFISNLTDKLDMIFDKKSYRLVGIYNKLTKGFSELNEYNFTYINIIRRLNLNM